VRPSLGPRSSSTGRSSAITGPTTWLGDLSPEEEHQTIAYTLSRLAEMTGKRPVGWLGSGLAQTWNTLDFLAEEGCLYVADSARRVGRARTLRSGAAMRVREPG
jgi:hypothetical protein